MPAEDTEKGALGRMDSFELNKFIGAFLGVVFVVFSISLLSDAVFSSPEPETPGYAIAVPEGGATEGGGEAQPAAESVLPLLASADASAGEAVFKRCGACHTVEQGGPNKVGPNLWSVVDRPIASHEGFSYSSALTEFSEGGQKLWTYENLDHFLASPKGLVPGTAMSFAGLSKVEDRANLIAYLRTMSDQPVPLPEAAPAGEEGAAAPAEGGEQTPPAEGEAAPPAEGAAPAEGTTAPAQDGAAPAEGAPAGDTQAPAQTEETTTPPATEGEAGGGTGETQPAPAQ